VYRFPLTLTVFWCCGFVSREGVLYIIISLYQCWWVPSVICCRGGELLVSYKSCARWCIDVWLPCHSSSNRAASDHVLSGRTRVSDAAHDTTEACRRRGKFASSILNDAYNPTLFCTLWLSRYRSLGFIVCGPAAWNSTSSHSKSFLSQWQKCPCPLSAWISLMGSCRIPAQ